MISVSTSYLLHVTLEWMTLKIMTYPFGHDISCIFPNQRGWNNNHCYYCCIILGNHYILMISRCFYSNPRTGETETTQLVFTWCGFTAPNERTTATRTNMIIPYYKSTFNYIYEIQMVLMYFWFTQIKILSVTGGFKIWNIWFHFSVSAMCSRGRGSRPLSPSPTPRISGGVGVLFQGHQGKVGKIQFDYLTRLRAGKDTYLFT